MVVSSNNNTLGRVVSVWTGNVNIKGPPLQTFVQTFVQTPRNCTMYPATPLDPYSPLTLTTLSPSSPNYTVYPVAPYTLTKLPLQPQRTLILIVLLVFNSTLTVILWLTPATWTSLNLRSKGAQIFEPPSLARQDQSTKKCCRFKSGN